MKYCLKCVMLETRPGISFNSERDCSACQTFENRKNVDYIKRKKELRILGLLREM